MDPDSFWLLFLQLLLSLSSPLSENLQHILANRLSCYSWSHCPLSRHICSCSFHTSDAGAQVCNQSKHKGLDPTRRSCQQQLSTAVLLDLIWAPPSNTHYKTASVGRKVDCNLFILLKWFQGPFGRCLTIDIQQNGGRANLREPHSWGSLQGNFSFRYLSLSEMSVHIFLSWLSYFFSLGFSWLRKIADLWPKKEKEKKKTILDQTITRKSWKTGTQVNCEHPNNRRQRS